MAHVQGHYKAIAQEYDFFYDHMYEELAEISCKWLKLLPTDSLADIGGGTGAISSLIWKKANLGQPVLVVDPSPDMLEPASKREGVLTLEATFDDLINSYPHIISKYNKFVCIGCIHLFPHLEASMAAFYKLLKPGDQLLIVEHPEVLVWKDLKTRFNSLDEIEEYLKQAGFSVEERGEESHSHSYSREKYFYSLRHRCYTALSLLTDKEIELGIKKLDETVFKGEPFKELTDYYYMIVATKT
ncbi:PREDICTED: uncharacterized protein LOC109589803 [Amphimedon queenslandica]|uniref:Methyltransferase type 12 domain-containing protein n=1 Tax=Amphimedon queenslandica TaxID=400682 RepID=A0AAN0JWC5_AMPQE|nr:PREDICTED: uncharacterized protein LOC109589803 [Amphimedon queenslandica]|eukprot:XP_019861374.1 PREDICTED: uncharacterized protein LOC109589803 [Amphimedon queenslandica]